MHYYKNNINTIKYKKIVENFRKKLTSKKEVPHFKYGHKLVFSRSDLLEWAKNQSTRQMTEDEILEEMDQRMKRKRA